MALSLSNIERWCPVLTGRSIYHVNQGTGEYFQKDEICGYYSNVIERVQKAPQYVDNEDMPSLGLGNGKQFSFPVEIFQFVFRLLDLYYRFHEEKYKARFRQCVDWTLAHQMETGTWDNFSYYYSGSPYGAMVQGEGALLLVRACVQFKEEEYLSAAKKTIDFMLLSNTEGGCTEYSGEKNVLLLEYPHRKAVLNGFIFSWWGLYDYILATGEGGVYKKVLKESLNTLIGLSSQFRSSYWSAYDLEGRMASPFYHNLHIAQMRAMYEPTGESIFNEYAKCRRQQQKNPICKGLAFIKKSIQRILEK